MGLTKTEHFTDEQNEMAVLLKAMAHPARIAIIDYLLSTDTCICNDIVDVLPLAQATVSQHLKELKNAGIIQGTIEGASIKYCINKETIHQFQTFIDHIFHKIEKQESGCC
ncbi:metalloregulator ArsR/SmtB family transcription factor [Chryseobacterium gotjawalense]|uniref:HTH-type transcriptional repressor SmtB n=2 Tax=Chryseobacterium TaxID=59732 RepID=A0A4P6ZF71_9FLAO|nr:MULTISPECIES: metalloregulator ArsR/SmtB family transcription factor [Chryseobacterium]MDQ0478139.1 ArsR family transcriptional regulator [Chryseobacterium sp. MDT2-18]QBO58231.1 HTH-type transcriptional repressor SmtB [Chryseobacterium salivictor]WHF51311.1 metalloregulator ArsR/SmtB family transcription factor [Chryseobacterium sp. wdc7]